MPPTRYLLDPPPPKGQSRMTYYQPDCLFQCIWVTNSNHPFVVFPKEAKRGWYLCVCFVFKVVQTPRFSTQVSTCSTRFACVWIWSESTSRTPGSGGLLDGHLGCDSKLLFDFPKWSAAGWSVGRSLGWWAHVGMGLPPSGSV